MLEMQSEPPIYAGEPSPPLGRYRLIAWLGQGGMAEVFLACTQGPRGFRKLLVIKLARFTGDPMFATMFLEEARIAAQLEHPNIVQTYEVAEAGSRHYLVMEYLDGGNLAQLRQRARKTGGISLRTSLTILAQVLDGLEYAHESRTLDGRDLKVVHRDLSPANIMVTAQGVVKILDFGIAKATDSYSVTHTGGFSGKLGYMPPEQLRCEPADARDDLFAFGVILAEAALQGRLWGHASDREIATRLGMGQIPALDRTRSIDPELRAICKRALAPEREQRYARACDLRADLASYLATLGGPISQRELAQFVCTTLRDDRARLQVVIDAQLQKYGAEDWDAIPTLPDLPRITYTPSRTGPTGPADAAVRDELVEDRRPSRVAEAAPAAVPAAPPPRKLGVRFLAFSGTLVVAATVFALMRRPEPAPSPPALSSTPPASAAPPASARGETATGPACPTLEPAAAPLGANHDASALRSDVQRPEADITPGTPETSEVSGHRTLTPRLAPARDAAAATGSVELHRRARRPPQGPATSPGPSPNNPPATETGSVEISSSPDSDGGISIRPPKKRVLDAIVLDQEFATSKLTIDRNPWGN
jgi:serine/threonine-protein kinase